MASPTRIKHIFIFILNLILAFWFSCLIVYCLNFIIFIFWDIDVLRFHKPMSINFIFSVLFVGLLYPGYKITNRFLMFVYKKINPN